MFAHKLTKQKIEDLNAELKHLKEEVSPLLSEELKRQRGDIQDEFDSDLTELLEEKEQTKKRILEIETILETCQIINENVKAKTVEIGTKVEVKIDGVLLEYRIVEAMEASPMDNKISPDSPIGKSLIDKKVGDEFQVLIGGIDKTFIIEKISY